MTLVLLPLPRLRPWTNIELREAQRLRRQKWTHSDIARQLCRTESSVRNKLSDEQIRSRR